jgi:hypothetical protein
VLLLHEGVALGLDVPSVVQGSAPTLEDAFIARVTELATHG